MRPLDPSQIHGLRQELDWSARQMGSFLDRSHQTIYNWESGSTEPDECVQAILHALRKELERRKNSEGCTSVTGWVDRLEEEGIAMLMQQLLTGRSGRTEIVSELVRKSEQNGGLLIEPPNGKSSLYLIPLTSEGIRRFLCRLKEAEHPSAPTEDEAPLEILPTA